MVLIYLAQQLFKNLYLGGNSLDLTLFGGTGGGGPIGSPGGSGTPTAQSNLISPTCSSSNQATCQLPVSQGTPNSTSSPYTNGRPPGSVALPGIHSVAARAAFINAGKSREDASNRLCSPQNVNGKKLPGLADVSTGGNDGISNSVNSATSISTLTSNINTNNHQSNLSDYHTNSVTKASSVTVSSAGETTVTRVAVMNLGANRNMSSTVIGGTNNSAIYSPEPPPMPMQQQSMVHSNTTNGSTNMSNSSSMMGVNSALKLPPLNSPLEHQSMHQAMLFGNVTSSSNDLSRNPSVTAGMMHLPPVETSSTLTNGVSF